MKLSPKQIELLTRIQDRLVNGDIVAIADKCNKSTVHVSRVLNPEVDVFNEGIVDAAVEIIDAREAKLNGHLQKLGVTNL